MGHNLFSVISFLPAEGATSNDDGHYGFISVKGIAKTSEEAEEIANEVSSNGSVIAVVLGDQYLPCIDLEKTSGVAPFKEGSTYQTLKSQLDLNLKLQELLNHNIQFLETRINQVVDSESDFGYTLIPEEDIELLQEKEDEQ